VRGSDRYSRRRDTGIPGPRSRPRSRRSRERVPVVMLGLATPGGRSGRMRSLSALRQHIAHNAPPGESPGQTDSPEIRRPRGGNNTCWIRPREQLSSEPDVRVCVRPPAIPAQVEVVCGGVLRERARLEEGHPLEVGDHITLLVLGVGDAQFALAGNIW